MFLAALPVAAVAITVPALGSSVNTEWETTKRSFAQADKRFDDAMIAYNRADSEQTNFERTAPQCEVTYTATGWRIANSGVLIEAEPRPAQYVLTQHQHTYAPDEVKGLPGYVAYKDELATWQERRNALAKEQGWEAAQQEWNAAYEVRLAAWRQLIAHPLNSASDLAEKMKLAQSITLDEDEAITLLDAVAADLQRMSARSAV
jgi:hypothetical protein